MVDWFSHLSPVRSLSLAQGLYYVVTGIWPLLSIRTFMKVTGPKTDIWLVKTVGVLIAVVGGVFLLSGSLGRVPVEVVALAVGCAVGLTAIDVWYVARRVIAPIYLLDAAAEVALIAAWATALTSRA